MSRWARASYSIKLHVPEIQRSNVASVGDFVLHEVIEDSGRFSLSEVLVFRQFLLPGIVTGIGADGRISSFRDRDGEHHRAPRKAYVVSQSIIDVPGLLANIRAEEERRNHWAAEFSDKKGIQHWLVLHQRHLPPVYPSRINHELS